MYACKWLGAIILCLTATLAQGAGIRAIDIPASADGPALKGAVWYLCAKPPEKVDLGKITLPGLRAPKLDEFAGKFRPHVFDRLQHPCLERTPLPGRVLVAA